MWFVGRTIMCLEEKVSRVKIGQKRQEDSEMKKLVKVEVAKAKQKSYEDLCNILDTRCIGTSWQRQRKEDCRMCSRVRVIKDTERKLL